MLNPSAFQVGVNLGGWISQYPTFDHVHFQSFITVKDIQRIASWGMDHVRLPVDYPVIEDQHQPGALQSQGMGYVDACLEWCAKNHLRVILDLHKAPGFAFDASVESGLFESPGLQERFLDLWSGLAERFAGKFEDSLAFELLNEIVLPDSRPWDTLISRALARIRAIDPARLVLVGGNYYNAPDQLDNLAPIADPQILYTFHYYLPLAVTHQKAPWVQPLFAYNHTLNYPGQAADGLEEFAAQLGTHRLNREVNVRFDQGYLRSMLQPAVDFSRKIGRPVYCGEFGVYEGAPLATRLNWTRDFVALLSEYHIGHAYWTYKALDFGLINRDGKVVSPELVEIVSQR